MTQSLATSDVLEVDPYVDEFFLEKYEDIAEWSWKGGTNIPDLYDLVSHIFSDVDWHIKDEMILDAWNFTELPARYGYPTDVEGSFNEFYEAVMDEEIDDDDLKQDVITIEETHKEVEKLLAFHSMFYVYKEQYFNIPIVEVW